MGKQPKATEDDVAKLYSTIQQLTATCDSYRCELQKQEDKNAKEVLKLNREIEKHQLEMCRLQDKLDHWKSTCHRQQNENVVIANSKLIARENSALKQDIEVFKTVVRRLNKEMAFYQENLRQAYQSSPDNLRKFSSDSDANSLRDDSRGGGDTRRDDLQNPSVTLRPLLTAYDEVIEDRNEIIRDHKRLMEKFKLKMQQVTQENERLHSVIAEREDKGTVSIEEWKSLYDNSILVLEENDLLHSKIDIMTRTHTAAEASHKERVEKQKKKIAALEDENTELKTRLNEMDKQVTLLTDQITKMSLTIQQRIPKEEHEASVSECHRLFDELKAKYARERQILANKVVEVGDEKEKITAQLNSTKAEIQKLHDTVKDLEKSNLEYAGSLVVLKKEFSISVKALQVNETNMKEMVKLAEDMAKEKDVLEKAYNEQRDATSKIMAIRSQELNLIKECEEKLRTVEADYEMKLEHHKSRASQLEDVLETIAERHKADLAHLHELIKEKNVHIEKLNNEKEQLTKDLETVWRATVSKVPNSTKRIE